MTAPEVELSRVWRRLVGTGHGRAADAAFDALLACHREPHRRYHTATHVMWVLRHVDEMAAQVDRPDRVDLDIEIDIGIGIDIDIDAVRAAALFHDAIYDPRSSTNEADSAVLAGEVLTHLGWAAPRVERVQQLIRATAGHVDAPDTAHTGSGGTGTGDGTGSGGTGVGGGTGTGDGVTLDLDILLDADLAILGAEPNDYRAYVAGVRTEYGHVDAAGWRAGRSAVLRQFLDRTTIYRTRWMRDVRERRARANLAAELATLDAETP